MQNVHEVGGGSIPCRCVAANERVICERLGLTADGTAEMFIVGADNTDGAGVVTLDQKVHA